MKIITLTDQQWAEIQQLLDSMPQMVKDQEDALRELRRGAEKSAKLHKLALAMLKIVTIELIDIETVVRVATDAEIPLLPSDLHMIAERCKSARDRITDLSVDFEIGEAGS